MFIGDSKIPTGGFTVQVGNKLWETRLCRVSHFNGGPGGWDLLSTMNINDWFFFLHTSARKPVASLQPPLFRGHGFHKEETQKFQKSQIILVPNYSFDLTKKIHAQTWYFHSQIKKLQAYEILKCHATFQHWKWGKLRSHSTTFYDVLRHV